MKFYYDLHVHSLLSPCGDEDNTPNNICGMAKLCGINILALTDHNTAKNCPAFFSAARRFGIIPVAGMELTTSEDIHVVCLFEELADALKFDSYVEKNRLQIKNRPEIFGNQSIVNDKDEPIGEIDELLISATSISCDDICSIVESFGGICYPAHIDRTSNGIIAILGTLPNCGFKYFEVCDLTKVKEYSERYSIPEERFIIDSDAHRLTDIRDGKCTLDLDCNDADEANVRRALFEHFRR